MAVVTKPNWKLIYIDPPDLNQAIRREYFPMRTIEEIAARMPNAKIFSVLDTSSGFWQIQLDNESANCACSILPLVVKCLNEPFGISSAQMCCNV